MLQTLILFPFFSFHSQGTWQTKFKAAETNKEIFYVSADQQKFVDMMHVEGTFSHGALRPILTFDPHPGWSPLYAYH